MRWSVLTVRQARHFDGEQLSSWNVNRTQLGATVAAAAGRTVRCHEVARVTGKTVRSQGRTARGTTHISPRAITNERLPPAAREHRPCKVRVEKLVLILVDNRREEGGHFQPVSDIVRPEPEPESNMVSFVAAFGNRRTFGIECDPNGYLDNDIDPIVVARVYYADAEWVPVTMTSGGLVATWAPTTQIALRQITALLEHSFATTLLAITRTERISEVPADQTCHPSLAVALRQIIERRASQHNLRIADVAADVGCSPNLASRSLKSGTGKRFWRILHDERCAMAERLLPDKSVPIKAVALMSGYRRTSDLDLRFKERFRMTPREWRSLHSRHRRKSA